MEGWSSGLCECPWDEGPGVGLSVPSDLDPLPSTGKPLGVPNHSHVLWPGPCFHWAPGEDLAGAPLHVLCPQAAASPHSCRGTGVVPGASRPQPLNPPSHSHPGLTISSHDRLPRRTVTVLGAHSVRNAFILPGEKGRLCKGSPAGSQLSWSHPRGRTRFLPCLGLHTL